METSILTSAELRAASERLRRSNAGELIKDVYHDPQYPNATNYTLAYHCDVADVASAYLAEHPADDSEPATFDDCEAALADTCCHVSIRVGELGVNIDSRIVDPTKRQLRLLQELFRENAK